MAAVGKSIFADAIGVLPSTLKVSGFPMHLTWWNGRYEQTVVQEAGGGKYKTMYRRKYGDYSYKQITARNISIRPIVTDGGKRWAFFPGGESNAYCVALRPTQSPVGAYTNNIVVNKA